MSEQTYALPQFDEVLKATATTARGGNIRLGRHRVTVRQASYFTGRNVSKATTCVVESVVVRTANTDDFKNLLTPDEERAGIKPYDQDQPHSPGEVLATVWKAEGAAATMFFGNVKGFMTHAKHSLFNMLEAYEQLGHRDAAMEIRKYYQEKGLNMAPDARNNVDTDGNACFHPGVQAYQGVDLYIISRRVKTKSEKRINASAYEPVPVAEWKKEIEEKFGSVAAA